MTLYEQLEAIGFVKTPSEKLPLNLDYSSDLKVTDDSYGEFHIGAEVSVTHVNVGNGETKPLYLLEIGCGSGHSVPSNNVSMCHSFLTHSFRLFDDSAISGLETIVNQLVALHTQLKLMNFEEEE